MIPKTILKTMKMKNQNGNNSFNIRYEQKVEHMTMSNNKVDQ